MRPVTQTLWEVVAKEGVQVQPSKWDGAFPHAAVSTEERTSAREELSSDVPP